MSTTLLPLPPLDFQNFRKLCKGFFRVYLATILKTLVRRTDTFCFFMSMNYVCPLFLFRRHVKRNEGSTRVRTLSK